MQEKLQKNYNHRNQKALSRCDLNPFSEVSVTKVESQCTDRQIFRKQGDSDRRFSTFYFFSKYKYLSSCHNLVLQVCLIDIQISVLYNRTQVSLVFDMLSA